MHHARRRHGDQDRIQRGDDDFTLEGAYCRLSRWDFDGTPKTGQSPRRGDTDSAGASTDDDLGEDAKASAFQQHGCTGSCVYKSTFRNCRCRYCC